MIRKLKFLLVVSRAYDSLMREDAKGVKSVQYIAIKDRYEVPQATFIMGVRRNAFRLSLFAADFFGDDEWKTQ